MIKYIFLILGLFILILFAVQVFVFELSKKKMDKRYGISWYETLNKPFVYTRARKMICLGGMAYVISSMGEPVDLSWLLYMALFIAMAVVSDAVVLYLTHIYARKRSKKEIQQFEEIKQHLLDEDLFENTDDSYEVLEESFNESDLYLRYIHDEAHIAFLSVDEGDFVKGFKSPASIVYDIEPFGNIESIQDKIGNENVKVTTLASENRLPFKDDKIDTLICRNVQFDKNEVLRVLKDEGYFIVSQNGALHLKEFIGIYAPPGLKLVWDAKVCAQHLSDANMKVVDEKDYFGTIRFKTIQSLYTYFLKTSLEFTDVKKYNQLYISAMYDIKNKGYYELSTHHFVVVSRK